MNFIIVLLFSLLSSSLSEEKKWSWGDSSDDKRQDHDSAAGRAADFLVKQPLKAYETFENPEGSPFRPGRPVDFRPPRDYPFRPDYNRPNFNPNIRPGRPNGFQGNGYGGEGILTGPGPLTEFDRCKCTEKFNCPSPGISYGQCDIGKKYCCYSLQNSYNRPSNLDIYPNRPHYTGGLYNRPEIGPGGSTGLVGRPPYDPYLGNSNLGVLVGPGGPTGIVGRPPYNPNVIGPGYNNRPNYGNSAGVLVGPGGPTGIVGRPTASDGLGLGYLGELFGIEGRSAKEQKKDESKQ